MTLLFKRTPLRSSRLRDLRRLITLKAISYDNIDQIYENNSVPLKRVIGPVIAQVIEGKGRGVIATADVQPGELLMICEPLAFLRGLDGHRPHGEDLIDKALSDGCHKNPWLKDLLFDGTQKSTLKVPDFSSSGASSAGSLIQADRLDETPPSSTPGATKKGTSSLARTGSKGFSGRKAPVQDFPGGVDRVTAKKVAKAISLNCFGDAHDDRAAAHCRGIVPTSHLGVWPEMSMINHSCSPNSINYVLGEAMVIRAAAPISLGDEVTISYLGKPQLQPVNLRIDELRENYSFTCECERCTAELIHMEKISGQYEELYNRVTTELGPMFMQAQKVGDMPTINEIRDELRSSSSRLFLTFRNVLLQPQVRNFFAASLYDLFELQIACETESMRLERMLNGEAQASQSKDSKMVILRNLNHCVKALEESSPGSDLHCILSSKQLYSSIELNGQTSPQAALALEACKRAHLYRYGPTSDTLTSTLMELNRTLYD